MISRAKRLRGTTGDVTTAALALVAVASERLWLAAPLGAVVAGQAIVYSRLVDSAEANVRSAIDTLSIVKPNDEFVTAVATVAADAIMELSEYDDRRAQELTRALGESFTTWRKETDTWLQRVEALRSSR